MPMMKDSGIKWIGEIPNEWEVLRVKDGFVQKKSKAHQDDPVVLSLARNGVKIRDMSSAEGQYAASYYDYNPVAVDDMLINPMDLISGDNCSLSKVEGVISPAYVNLRYKHGFVPGYYQYYFKYQYWSMAFFAHGKGVSFDNRWTLNTETLMKYPLLYPSMEEQAKIASFLDFKCAEIDALSADIQAEIDTLEEYKKSVITEAVTKGLNPNVEMKDSGVEWIGKIPKHWLTKSVKYCFNIENGSDPITKEGPTPVYGSGAGSFKSCVEFKVGPTVLLGRKGTIDIPQWIEGNYWNVDTAFNVIEKGNYSLRLFYYVSMCFDYKKYSTQTALPSMTQGNYLDFKIPYMSAEEQNRIVQFLDSKCLEIDSIISDKKKQFETLVEYKKSLIYEYVTGKKEVPEKW